MSKIDYATVRRFLRDSLNFEGRRSGLSSEDNDGSLTTLVIGRFVLVLNEEELECEEPI